MDSPISRAECNLHMEDVKDGFDNLRDEIKTGFTGLNNRLDKLNGNTQDNTIAIAEIKARDLVIKTAKDTSEGKRRHVTVWDVIIVAGGMAILFQVMMELGYHR